jgi:hypothetical protein
MDLRFVGRQQHRDLLTVQAADALAVLLGYYTQDVIEAAEAEKPPQDYIADRRKLIDAMILVRNELERHIERHIG